MDQASALFVALDHFASDRRHCAADQRDRCLPWWWQDDWSAVHHYEHTKWHEQSRSDPIEHAKNIDICVVKNYVNCCWTTFCAPKFEKIKIRQRGRISVFRPHTSLDHLLRPTGPYSLIWLDVLSVCSINFELIYAVKILHKNSTG